MSNGQQKKNRKYDVWSKTNGICAHCGKTANGLNKTIDHYVPRSQGGGFDRRNLFPLCKACNHGRADQPIEPALYYRYAKTGDIQKALAYENEMFAAERTLADTEAIYE